MISLSGRAQTEWITGSQREGHGNNKHGLRLTDLGEMRWTDFSLNLDQSLNSIPLSQNLRPISWIPHTCCVLGVAPNNSFQTCTKQTLKSLSIWLCLLEIISVFLVLFVTVHYCRQASTTLPTWCRDSPVKSVSAGRGWPCGVLFPPPISPSAPVLNWESLPGQGLCVSAGV